MSDNTLVAGACFGLTPYQGDYHVLAIEPHPEDQKRSASATIFPIKHELLRLQLTQCFDQLRELPREVSPLADNRPNTGRRSRVCISGSVRMTRGAA